MTDDDALTADLLACEIADKVPMELVLHPVTVFQLVGLLQLALRHPSLSGVSQAPAQRFISAAREYFFDCPTVLAVIERGDDPAQDRVPRSP